MSARCVVDASVAVKQFVTEALSEQAGALFDLLAVGDRSAFYVPDTFYYEVAATLRKYAMTAGYPHLKAEVAKLAGLNLAATSTVELLVDAVQISTDYVLSIYDALYLALSVRVAAPLITADERLLRSTHGKPFDVHSLAVVDPANL
jgi:predicted nucleic acid-binding protein